MTQLGHHGGVDGAQVSQSDHLERRHAVDPTGVGAQCRRSSVPASARSAGVPQDRRSGGSKVLPGWTCASDSSFLKAGGSTWSASTRPAVAAMLAVARSPRPARWESIWVYDHFHTVPVPTDEATHEAWTLMAAFAAATSRGCAWARCAPAWATATPRTWPRSPRPSTSSAAAGSRWASAPAGTSTSGDAYGYGFPTAGERLAMLDEGVQIMSAAWRDGVATLAGEHYQVDGAICQPPAQGRCRTAASRCGSPGAGRRRPCGRRRSTPSTPTSTAR